VEFLKDTEVIALLEEQGITHAEEPTPEQEEVRLHMQPVGDAGEPVQMLMTTGEADAGDGVEVITLAADALADAVDGILHRMHLSQLLLIPVGKWRKIFDAVAFSLAENETWQEVDTTATVELNTRDPLLCEPADFQTVSALLRALLSDGETADQGLMITSTAAPFLVEIIPTGAVKVSFGNQVLADEATDAIRG
jgi:hypothetical protein